MLKQVKRALILLRRAEAIFRNPTATRHDIFAGGRSIEEDVRPADDLGFRSSIRPALAATRRAAVHGSSKGHSSNFRMSKRGLRQFMAFKADAISSMEECLHEDPLFSQVPFRERQECNDALSFCQDVVYSTLEFGEVKLLTDYLRWAADLFSSRGASVGLLQRSVNSIIDLCGRDLLAADADVVRTVMAAATAQSLQEDKSLYSAGHPEAWDDSPEIEDLLLAGDHRKGETIIEKKLSEGFSLVDVNLHMIQPSLYRIGHKWQRNVISVANEHVSSETAKFIMARKLGRADGSSHGKTILLACVQDNHHDIGLQMVSYAFQYEGWNVRYLGANVPTIPLVRAALELCPDVVGLSISLPQQFRSAVGAIAALRENLATPIPVMIGGLAVNSYPTVAGQIGANDISFDVQSALDFAESFRRQQVVH